MLEIVGLNPTHVSLAFFFKISLSASTLCLKIYTADATNNAHCVIMSYLQAVSSSISGGDLVLG